jgi:hypothetical protein
MQYKGFQINAPVQADIDPQSPMVVFYRIYAAGGAGAGRAFKVRAEAFNERGDSHAFPAIDLASSALPASPTETAIGFMLPCKDLKPGRYRLRVETVEAASGQSVVSETDFQVLGSDRDPSGKSMPKSGSGQPKPAPAAPPRSVEGTWAPPDIDRAVYPLTSGKTCSLPEVLTGAGKRIEELIRNVDRFTATETVEHQDVGRRGNLLNPEIRKFDYMVSIQRVRDGFMNLEEYRDRAFTPDVSPNRVATLGTPGVVLIFHPWYIRDFDVVCEGLGDWNGQRAWLVRFEQRKDRPNNIRSYHIDGVRYDVRLRGRAWIKADTYEIVRLETDLAETIPKIQLHLEHMRIEYQPVNFPERKVQLWLPKNAEMYLDYRGHRFRRQHNFTDFKLFSVETKQEIARP